MPDGHAPLSSELRHYTAYPVSSGSHLGSTLSPGRAVLTRGVSRRSGSVAYIRADASPTEVLACLSWHRNRCTSNVLEKNLVSTPRLAQISPHSRGLRPHGAGPFAVGAA
jgi:hypothetical protein